MALSREQSLAQYGTVAYTGWGEVEAAADAAAKGLSAPANAGGGEFGFDFEAEVDKAFEDLGQYYGELLAESQGDVDLALARLEEDFKTGRRFAMQSFNLSQEALDLAQEATAIDAEILRERNVSNLNQRGLFRKSMRPGADNRLGIGDVQTQRVEGGIERAQASQDLAQDRLDTGFAQSEELATTQKERLDVDIPEAQRRVKRDLEERRKREAGELALSRSARAFQRFESGLI